ncbi:MAG: phage major tail tube protein [Vampirovibrionales bacterium]
MTGRQVLKNFSLFLNGDSYKGKAEDVTPPKFTFKTEEYRLGGMDVPLNVEMGMEALTLSFTLMAYNKEALKLMGNTLLPTRFVLKGALQDELVGTIQPVEIVAVGRFKSVDLGQWKAGEASKIQFESMALPYYSYSQNGELLHLIDVNNMVRVINGFDQLAAQRLALGL